MRKKKKVLYFLKSMINILEVNIIVYPLGYLDGYRIKVNKITF